MCVYMRIYVVVCVVVFVRMCMHVWLYVPLASPQGWLLTAPLATSTKFRVYVCMCACIVYVCICACMSACIRAPGFARGLSVDSAAGAVYRLDSLIYTGP